MNFERSVCTSNERYITVSVEIQKPDNSIINFNAYINENVTIANVFVSYWI